MSTIKDNKWEEISSDDMYCDDIYEYIEIEEEISNKDYGYNSVKKLVDRGMDQVNIHKMICKESLNEVYEIFSDYINGDERLKGLNAIVLLSLKTKGRGDKFTPLSQDEFTDLVKTAMDNEIPIGFDSCSQHKFINSIMDHPDYKRLEMLSEPCESSLFSAYINSKGEFSPCSFCENTNGWESGIKVDTCVDFLNDVWYDVRTISFRQKLLDNNRNCPVFNV